MLRLFPSMISYGLAMLLSDQGMLASGGPANLWFTFAVRGLVAASDGVALGTVALFVLSRAQTVSCTSHAHCRVVCVHVYNIN